MHEPQAANRALHKEWFLSFLMTAFALIFVGFVAFGTLQKPTTPEGERVALSIPK